jgi:hypothetical protein
MSDWSWAVAQQWWQTKILLSTATLMIVHEFILWRGPLGEVNRGALRAGKFSLKEIWNIRRLTFRWSIALWQGLFLGMLDALRSKNGHRPLFRGFDDKLS